MSNRRWTFRTLPDELRNTNLWRKVDITSLPTEDVREFEKMQAAIVAYLATGSLRRIAAEAGTSSEEILRSLNRCVTPAPDGSIFGWQALMPGKRVVPFTRRTELPKGRRGLAKGFVGAFSAFLMEHPDIQDRLETLVLKKNKSGVVHESKISAKSLHKTFVRLCEEAGLTREDYPLNSKSCGRRSVERYMRQLIEENVAAGTLARYGKEAAKHLKVGTGHPARAQSFAPYDLVGLDAHKIDCFGTVRINGPAGPQRVAIERIWIVPVLEHECRLILGYGVGIRTECSAATIEQALMSALNPWSPRKPVIPTMTYRPNAGLPSGVFPELAGCAWTVLTIDNAAAHFAKAIAERARRRIGCTVTYGPIGRWDHRAVLERLMGTLETYGFQRLPSTTGSSPVDPRREDPVGKAIDLGIDYEVLLDLVDIIAADYNVTQTEPLGNRAPLSAMRDHLYGGEPTFLPRRLPPPTAGQPELGIVVERKTIRGSREKGKRPSVIIDRVPYTSPLLANSMGLIGRQILVHIRESDFRTVTAYFPSGEELGVLTAQGAWGRTPHTREMRKQVNALRDAGELHIGMGQGPIEALLEYYGQQAHASAAKRPRSVSRAATKLANAANASGLPIPEVKAPAPSAIYTPASEPATPSRLVKPPIWKTVVR